MKKQNRRLPTLVRRLKRAPVLMVIVLLVAGSAPMAVVHADQFDAQIQNLQTQNAQNHATVNSLQTQAASYQDEITKLQSQIGSIQSQISANQAKQAQLQAEIEAAQLKVIEQKRILGEDLKAMYVGGQLTTVEMLATSKNLSDFVDAETYGTAVQNKIQDTLKQIAQLENQLRDQKNQVVQLLQTQQAQQSQLSAARAEQNQLLSLNQGQQDAYNQKIQANQAQIGKLRAEQIAANTSGVQRTLSRGTCGGGYPNYLCSAPQDSIIDPWHMLNRECVSYTGWRASSESPVANALLQEYNFGNAGDWPSSARTYGAKYGVTVSTTPQVGDIAIRLATPGVYVAPGDPDVGHAMYVEAVNGDGTITVSEYNEYLDGTYSEEVRATAGNYHGSFYQLQFIHFPQNLLPIRSWFAAISGIIGAAIEARGRNVWGLMFCMTEQTDRALKKIRRMHLSRVFRLGRWAKFGLAAVVALGIFALGMAVGDGRIAIGAGGPSKNLPSSLNFASVNQVYRALKQNYDGKLTTSQLLDGLKAGLAQSTGDPYTEYFTAKEASQFNGELNNSFEGIGAQLGADAQGDVEIIAPIAGTPAATAGLKPKDIIANINGVSTSGLSPDGAVGKIRGPAGTKVILGIVRNGSQALTFTITRQNINIPTVTTKILSGDIGYLQISSFGDDTSNLAEQAAQKFVNQDHVRAVILDLRDNPGGEVNAAVDVSSLWLPAGKLIMNEKGVPSANQTYTANGNDTLHGLPTVVLTNDGSASASEITAGALHDNGAATIIGTKTYGKGVVQQIINLSGGAELKVTVASWYRPNGQNINHQGITPDQTVQLTDADAKAGNDTQLHTAESWLASH